MCARSFNRDVGGALLQANGRYAGSHMMPLWRMGIPGHMGTQVNRIEWVFADKSSRSWEAQQAGHRNKVTELEVPAEAVWKLCLFFRFLRCALKLALDPLQTSRSDLFGL